MSGFTCAVGSHIERCCGERQVASVHSPQAAHAPCIGAGSSEPGTQSCGAFSDSSDRHEVSCESPPTHTLTPQLHSPSACLCEPALCEQAHPRQKVLVGLGAVLVHKLHRQLPWGHSIPPG